jgi:hypothetical protein
MSIRYNLNEYRKTSLGAGTLLMFFLIEVTRDSLGWFTGLGLSIIIGLLLSVVLENSLDYLKDKK